VKRKTELPEGRSLDDIYSALAENYNGNNTDLRDGIKIEFEHGWVQLRASNTEPIIRIYSESVSLPAAEGLISEVVSLVKKI
jgi:phosphomannomutase